MSASESTIYEVHVRRGGVWQFDMSMSDQEDAITEAQRLAAKGAATKVTREVFCEEDRTFRSQTIYKSDTAKKAPLSAPEPKRAVQATRLAPRPQPVAKKGFLGRLFG